MANITQINVNGTTYDLKDNISGYTTAYDGTTTSDTKYDALFLETLASGVDTVKVGLDMDLLWTNSSPTSDFLNQTISLDLSGYELIYIVFTNHVAVPNSRCMLSLVKNASSEPNYYPFENANDGVPLRGLFSCNNEGVSIGTRQFHRTSISWTTENGLLVPYKIYGIR